MIGPDLAIGFLLMGVIIGLKLGRWRADGILAKKDQQLKNATRAGQLAIQAGAAALVELDRSNQLLNQYAPDRARHTTS